LEEKRNLKNYLFIEEVSKQNEDENSESFLHTAEVLSFVEEEMFPMLNVEVGNGTKNILNQALFLLFVQGIKSMKSSIILCKEGYLTNAIMCARNIIETIFNITYLIGDEKQSEARAKEFLSKPGYWTNRKVIERAYMELNRPLYEIYRTFSNYTHSNLMGVSQNINDDGNISSWPSTDKIPTTINMSNALFYFMIDKIVDHYQIKSNRFRSIKFNEDTENILASLYVEEIIWDDLLVNLFREMKFTEEQIKNFRSKYTKEALKPPKKKRKRNKKNRK